LYNAGLHTPSAAEFPTLARPVRVERKLNWLPAAAVTLGVGAIWLAACRYLSAEWSFNEQYNYGWFVPFFAAYLFWLRWEDRPQPEITGQRSGLIGTIALLLIIASCLVLLPLRIFEIGSADWRPLGWIHVGAAATITLSLIYLIGGFGWLRHFSFPVLFLFVAVPWISAVEEPIVQGLMRLIAASAAETLALFGVPAEVQGNLIRLPNGLVGVNEACSGVRSLQTSLTIGLLFGELKRLKLSGRLLLVTSAIGIALFANFLRATFLVWIASSQTTGAIKQWHDAAGYAIVVLVFLGTMWLAGRFRGGIMNQRSEVGGQMSDVKHRTLITSHRSLLTLGFGLLLWSGLVEAGAESWYRLHERNSVPRAGWSVHWPENAAGYQEIKIDSEVRNLLRFDYGREAMWNSGSSSAGERGVHYMYFMRWNPGTGTILRARAHRPDICLPAAGWTQVDPDQIRNFEIAPGRSLPFHRFEFVKQNGRVLHAIAYFTLHEDVAHESEMGANAAAGLYSNWDWSDRWRVVRNGIRNRGQQVLEAITVTNSRLDERVSDGQFAQLLPQLVQPR
jgi:exosortase